MKLPSPKTARLLVPLPTATFKTEFGKKQRCSKPKAKQRSAPRIPRVARLLALAYRVDGMIRSGELKNWAEAARLIGITRARMTQIANLAVLAPAIQGTLLDIQGVGSPASSVVPHQVSSPSLPPSEFVAHQQRGDFR